MKVKVIQILKQIRCLNYNDLTASSVETAEKEFIPKKPTHFVNKKEFIPKKPTHFVNKNIYWSSSITKLPHTI